MVGQKRGRVKFKSVASRAHTDGTDRADREAIWEALVEKYSLRKP
jgi:hypothetical protein